MKKPLAAAAALAAITLSGCATQGRNSLSYQEPTATATTTNETTLQKPYSEVWDSLVRELSKSFYVINNIDKESRIINLSFTSQQPTDYIDCGRSTRVYTQGERTERWEYPVAGKAAYKVASDRQDHPAFAYYANINRSTALDGRANIYIAPVPDNAKATNVSINARYALTIRMSGDVVAEHVSGAIHPRGQIHPEPTVIAFNTNHTGRHDQAGGPPIICNGTGKFEREIIDMLRR